MRKTKKKRERPETRWGDTKHFYVRADNSKNALKKARKTVKGGMIRDPKKGDVVHPMTVPYTRAMKEKGLYRAYIMPGKRARKLQTSKSTKRTGNKRRNRRK